MALNPYFTQGTRGEQGLVQDLINEQLRMYGVDVHYIPRKYVTQNTVIREVIRSQFDEKRCQKTCWNTQFFYFQSSKLRCEKSNKNYKKNTNFKI